jgi:rhodanese-related sulfurtransferase
MDPASLDNYITEIQKSKKSPLIVCARGATASGIAAKLKKSGVEADVYALAGGMLKWTEDKLPTVRK